MRYVKKTVRDFNPQGKRVLLRCDFNVPLNKETGEIRSDKRIRAPLPTIRYLLEHGAAVIVCSHLGKPKGEWKPELSLRPVAKCLSELLQMPVKMADDVIGESAQALAAELKPGELMVLENTRFHKEESKNDPEFSKKLASFADVYVSDAFGTAHRNHASTAGAAAYLPAYSGFLMETELKFLGRAMEKPAHPFVAVLGGAKVSDKLDVIQNLLEKADKVIIGGGMAYTFLKALGHNVGASLVEDDKIGYCLEMLEKAKKLDKTLLLPVDLMVADRFAADADSKVVDIDAIPEGWMGMGIGPKTQKIYADAVQGAGTVVWNGPLGVFEFPAFAEGTRAMAQALADLDAMTIVGGGDSVSAVEQMGFSDKITHISTGGGASLDFFAGKDMPGVMCLLDQ
ncbi:MAG: phosphoglycerate kinase [Eubacteriales bacterium]|nr:phosphoglycerate kinase [Eubacteriales bacterium]